MRVEKQRKRDANKKITENNIFKKISLFTHIITNNFNRLFSPNFKNY